jgi:hypothetical protein
MKTGAAVATLFAIAASLVMAALLSLHEQANSEAASNALVLAERSASRRDHARASSSAFNKPLSSAALQAEPSPARAAPSLILRRTSTALGTPLLVPDPCDGDFDVLLHFHGAHPYIKEVVERANLRAVVAVYNAGVGAEAYAQAYAATDLLRALLVQIEAAAAPLCAPGSKVRRVALSGWSAGYAAVQKLLSRPEDRARVDAVLLADGLHAAFVDPARRALAPNALQSLRDFAELAKQKQKLFAITHSSIATDGYASTSECSRFLLQVTDVPCDEPFASGKFGDFTIEGSGGEDKAAHVAQLKQMDETLLAKLRKRWQGP